MNKISHNTVLHTLTGIALTLAGSGAFASDTWDLTTCDTGSNTNLGYNKTCNLSADAAGLKLYGYTNGRGTPSAPNPTNNGDKFVSANIYDWSSGNGILSGNEANIDGPHAIDNGYGIEALMIRFSAGPITLSGLSIGWNGHDNPITTDNNGTNSGGGSEINYNDSDLSVFAWTGSGKPTVTGKKVTETSPTGLMGANSGWTLVANLADVGNKSGNTAALSTSIYSSYWLVSAYSSAYGGTGIDEGNDTFKLQSLMGSLCAGTVTNGACGGGGSSNGVPEPGSLALMGVALAGFAASRRRKQPAA